MSKLIVKPSKGYLYWGLVFLAFGAFYGVAAVFVAPGDDPLWIRLAVGPFAALPAAILLLPYKWVRVEIDDYGITSHRLLRPTRRYPWDEITDAEVEWGRHGYYPCVIRSNGKTAAKVPRKFDGYEQMLNLLIRRGLLKEDNNSRRAREWNALSKVKPADVIGREMDMDMDGKRSGNTAGAFQPADSRRRWPFYLAIFGVAIMFAALIVGFFNGDVSLLLFLLGAIVVFAASVTTLAVNGKTMARKAKANTVIAIIISGTFLAFMCIAVYLGSRY